MVMYHIAKSDIKKNDTLKTSVPSGMIKEEGDIPRICVTNNPFMCILALHPIDSKCKIYRKSYTTLTTWVYEKQCYMKLNMNKMKDIFRAYKLKFPHSNVTLSDTSDEYHVCFRYRNISIDKIKLLIRLFRCCGTITFIREDEEKSFIFYSIKNVQLLEVMEKSYLPPNASDFRFFGERWIINDTKNYKVLGRIDMVSLFKKRIMRFTNKKYTIIHDLPKTKLGKTSKIKYEIY